MLPVDGNAGAIVSDAIALVYDASTGAVLLQRVQPRDDGSYTGILTLRTFNTPEQLELIYNTCFA